MVIRSDKFDDVYFSTDDGMAETHHVFLNGNNLPKAWNDKARFTIAETGFGTGLNFLCAWKLFDETAKAGQKLHFISVEKYPLSKDDIRDALAQWQDDLGNRIDRFLDLYPIRVPGPHQIHIADNVTLTIWFGDVADCIPEWQTPIDSWFLDGFTPTKNPDMWSESLFENMARLSHSDTTLATFTAAGFVRRGLETAGFDIQKTKGFGHKRDMVVGRYNGKPIVNSPQYKTIAIIGGGLAGCAIAYHAHRMGLNATIYEAGDTLASGASGGKLGMINPKLTAKPSPQADYYTASYANALRLLSQLDEIDFNVHGSLHLCTDDDKARRFKGYIDNLGWHDDHIYKKGDDLYYPDGASVSPEKLCHALSINAKIHSNKKIENLLTVDADIIVLANGYAVNDLIDSDIEIPVSTVRGQVSWIKPQHAIDKNICFGRYVTPLTSEGFHVLGASFQPWEMDITLKDADHQDNVDGYNATRNPHISMDDVIGGWAGFRTASKDRFPIVGHLRDNIFVSTAHGSHGIISSMMAAQIIMASATGTHMPASTSVLSSLSPLRFNRYGDKKQSHGK